MYTNVWGGGRSNISEVVTLYIARYRGYLLAAAVQRVAWWRVGMAMLIGTCSLPYQSLNLASGLARRIRRGDRV